MMQTNTAHAARGLSERAADLVKETSGVHYASDLTSWEAVFIQNIASQNLSWGSPKQADTIARIELKVFGKTREHL